MLAVNYHRTRISCHCSSF